MTSISILIQICHFAEALMVPNYCFLFIYHSLMGHTHGRNKNSFIGFGIKDEETHALVFGY